MKKLLFLLTFYFSLLTFNSFSQWQLINHPYGYGFYSLATNGAYIFAGDDSNTLGGSALFFSTDSGANWNSSKDMIFNENKVYALTIIGKNIFAGTYREGVYLSTDNGTSWNRVDSGLYIDEYTVVTVTALSSKGDSILAGTDVYGIFLSTNNGTSWNSLNNGLGYKFVNSIAVKGSNIFAGTYLYGIFLSTNNGESWNSANEGLTNKSINAISINGNRIFVGTNNGIFLSTNNGENWKIVYQGLPDSTCIYSLLLNNTDVFAGTLSRGVVLSTDNGINWNNVNNGLPDSISVYSLALYNNYILAGTSAGIWKRSLSDILGLNEIQSQNSNLKIEISPNPVSQITKINYQIPDRSKTTIKIYDITGREVETLVNEVKDKGNYSIEYNSEQLKSGIYFLNLTTDAGTQTVKFIKE